MGAQIQVLELYCGIGGCAAALQGSGRTVVGAVDQSPAALAVHRLNFPEVPVVALNLEDVTGLQLESFRADLWWLSPPCQPYTVRGARRDLDDPRATSLKRIVSLLIRHGPAHLAFENVEGFADSRARTLLLETLDAGGWHFNERMLCPSELGIPNRRPRWYLFASKLPLPAVPRGRKVGRPLSAYLDPDPDPALLLPEEVVRKFGRGLRILDAEDPEAYTTCFTSGYGRSLQHSGSYLRWKGGVRRFSPLEIARLLHFPEGFRFPAEMPLQKQWQLVGNSLSVAAVREVLRQLPDSS